MCVYIYIYIYIYIYNINNQQQPSCKSKNKNNGVKLYVCKNCHFKDTNHQIKKHLIKEYTVKHVLRDSSKIIRG